MANHLDPSAPPFIPRHADEKLLHVTSPHIPLSATKNTAAKRKSKVTKPVTGVNATLFTGEKSMIENNKDNLQVAHPKISPFSRERNVNTNLSSASSIPDDNGNQSTQVSASMSRRIHPRENRHQNQTQKVPSESLKVETAPVGSTSKKNHRFSKGKPKSTTAEAVKNENERHSSAQKTIKDIVPLKTQGKRVSKHFRSLQRSDTVHSLGSLDSLSERLAAATYECMICCECVSTLSHTWSCSTCYAVFHLKCVQEWAKKSTERQQDMPSRAQRANVTEAMALVAFGNALPASSSPVSSALLPSARAPVSVCCWPCPGCRETQSSLPTEYRCFCGRSKNPEVSDFLLAHSCGQVCGRLRPGTKCPHPCTLPCHPGPCPTCPAAPRTEYCFCGKQTFSVRCSDPFVQRPCQEICGKPLICRSENEPNPHRCPLVCHEGPCPKCDIVVTHTCYCGQTTHVGHCGDKHRNSHKSGFSCGKMCQRALSCGKHNCSATCHEGECGDCVQSTHLVDRCPCGKSPLVIPRTSCTDPIPTCSHFCEKELSCISSTKFHKKHACRQRCHTGPCAPTHCNELLQLTCQCGHQTETFRCGDLSDSSYLSAKSIIIDETVTYLCNKVCRMNRLCGRHVCHQRCCPATKTSKSKETASNARLRDRLFQDNDDDDDEITAHTCLEVCGKRLSCKNHICERLCHRGACGPCPLHLWEKLECACGQTRLLPPLPCGTPPPVCSLACQKPAVCQHHPKIPHACHDGDCPPCTVLTQKVCGCAKSLLTVPCFQRAVTCTLKCEKLLKCGLHGCKASCHDASCPDTNCRQPCPRKRDCGHACGQPCHNETVLACASINCNEMIKKHCPCRRRSMEVPCYQQQLKEMACDDICQGELRKKLFAEALGVLPERSTDTVLNGISPYSEAMYMFAQLYDPQLVWISKMEELLNSFCLDAPRKFLHLPVMKREKRACVYEWVKAYHMEAYGVDEEPKRSVIVKKRMESSLPLVPFSKAYKLPQRPLMPSQESLSDVNVGETPLKMNKPMKSMWDDDFVTVGDRQETVFYSRTDYTAQSDNPYDILSDERDQEKQITDSLQRLCVEIVDDWNTLLDDDSDHR